MKKILPLITLTSLFAIAPAPVVAAEAGSQLNQKQTQQILTCLGDTTDQQYEWVKDYFLYSSHIDCFGTRRTYKSSGGKEYNEFYDIKPIETLSGITIAPNSAIVENIRYTMEDALSINPDFVIWLEKTFVDAAADDSATNEMLAQLYTQNRHIARTFLLAYNNITQEKNLAEEIQKYQNTVIKEGNDALAYLEQYTPSQDYDIKTYEYDTEAAQSGYEDNYNRFRFSIGFWLRRGIDGSLPDFVRVMDKLMTRYDNEWYQAHKK